MKSEKLKVMVEKFQCPGCVCGSDTKCGKYKPIAFNHEAEAGACVEHVPGTFAGPVTFALGLPKGFNRLGPTLWKIPGSLEANWPLALWPVTTPDHPGYDRLNIAVWAMEGGTGHLFVRVMLPRLGRCRVDVIEGATLAHAPSAINVAEFIDEID